MKQDDVTRQHEFNQDPELYTLDGTYPLFPRLNRRKVLIDGAIYRLGANGYPTQRMAEHLHKCKKERHELMSDTTSYDAIEKLLESTDPTEVAHGKATLHELDAVHQDDAHVQYLIASAYDSAGHEAQAMQHYQRALAIGVEHLPAERQPEIFVQAGSTLRNLKRFDQARAMLEAGIARFPGYRALRVFLALLEASAGDRAKAADLLFDAVVMDEDSSLARYRRSLQWYVDDLAGRHKDES